MKQKTLVQEVYQACLDNNQEKLDKLRKTEFKKIFKHKESGKSFDTKWTLVRI